MRVHVLAACLLRAFFLTRRLLFGFAVSIVPSALLFLTPYAPRSHGGYFAFTSALLVLVPVYAAISTRAILNRDGWLDDRPRAVILPVTAAEYAGSVIGMSLAGSAVVAMVSLSIVVLGARVLGHLEFLGTHILLLLAIDLLLAVALSVAQMLATLILRRFDPAPLMLAAASLLVMLTRFAYGFFSDRSPAIWILASIAVGGFLLIAGTGGLFLQRALSSFRDPYPR